MERLSDAVAKSEESEALKKGYKTLQRRYSHLMADMKHMVRFGIDPCHFCDGRKCTGCWNHSNWHWTWQEDAQPERKGGDYRSFLMQRFERGSQK